MKEEFTGLFDKYIPETLNQCKKAFKHAIP